MFIENLILEVTRSCNLKCKHCLRGCSESCHFNTNYLDNVFSDVEGIGTITFTGGEPLLKIRTIVKTLNYISEHNIMLGGFYIVHNGTIFSKYLMDILLDFYNNYVDEKSLCGFSLSRDKCHLEQIKRLKFVNRYYDYFVMKDCGYEFISFDRNELVSLIECGRAVRNKKSIEVRFPSYNRRPKFCNGFPKDENGELEIDTQVYVSANGNVISNCDLSYHIIDKYAFGNIKKNGLVEIIKNCNGTRYITL